jgi:hypothetical protein
MVGFLAEPVQPLLHVQPPGRSKPKRYSGRG